MSGNKKLFLSAMSSEFISYRNLLAGDLKRLNLDVAVQEQFVVTGCSTLGKLDTYIRHCDVVIHLIGNATGGVPELIESCLAVDGLVAFPRQSERQRDLECRHASSQ